jgi:hypothetical protein
MGWKKSLYMFMIDNSRNVSSLRWMSSVIDSFME